MSRKQIIILTLIIFPLFSLVGILWGRGIYSNIAPDNTLPTPTVIAPTSKPLIINHNNDNTASPTASITLNKDATPAGMIRVELLDGPWDCDKNYLNQIFAARDYMAQISDDLELCIANAATVSAQADQAAIVKACSANLEKEKVTIDSYQKTIDTHCQKI